MTAASSWERAAACLHQRVTASIETPVLRDVAELHRPHGDALWLLTCRGCDRDSAASDDALWPCRTYTLLARAVLGVSDVEELLGSLRE